jgi:REP element-mobilizing transposase RayT
MLHVKKNIKVSVYVIMPNHIHLVLFVPDLAEKINKIISNGKRFMAYEIVKRLKEGNKKDILLTLKQGVSEKDKRRRKIHQVFELSFDLKVLSTEKFIGQKINYIHANPVNKKWKLVDDYRKYQHSSAGFYEDDEGYKGYAVTHYLKVLD